MQLRKIQCVDCHEDRLLLLFPEQSKKLIIRVYQISKEAYRTRWQAIAGQHRAYGKLGFGNLLFSSMLM